jgi:hypothetical protein
MSSMDVEFLRARLNATGGCDVAGKVGKNGGGAAGT